MTNVAFRQVDDPPGLEIRDRVSKRQFTLHTSAVAELEPASTKPFVFPVDRACNFVTEELLMPEFTVVNVRDGSGAQLASIEADTSEQLSPGNYILEFTGRVKTYVMVEGPLSVAAGTHHVSLSFESPAEVTLGARAHLRRPPTTVTTTRDVDDVRRAVETFSSSLHTLSPERSYPTLRGHPPRLELGDELDIPATAAPPDSGISLTVRPELAELFTVAPLSYYLGATLEFGGRPRLETENGFVFDLDDRDVEDVLKHVFLLDCLVRTHGLYQQKHGEYEELAPDLPLDLPALYDATPAERIERYLSVPTSVTRPHVPQWSSATYVDPTADSVDALPYLVDDLALIRTDGVDRHTGPTARRVALSQFVSPTEDTRGASAVFEGRESFVDVPTTDARNQIWVGDGIPINASKFVTAGYEHRVQREPNDRHRLHVTVVCNEPSMTAEAATIQSRYQPYDDEAVEVDIHERLSTHDVAELLRTDTDFFHFIGHATEDGLECHDGSLDATTVGDVECDSFLLNACQSYRQGCALVEQGAIGGIVTLSDVTNDAAVETGGLLALLLDTGFTLGNALTITRRASVVGGQYTLVGDGQTALKRTTNRVVDSTHLESTADGYELWIDTFLDDIWRLGSQTNSKVPGGWQLSLSGGKDGPFEVTTEQALEYLELGPCPVWLDGEFHWSTELTSEGFGD